MVEIRSGFRGIRDQRRKSEAKKHFSASSLTTPNRRYNNKIKHIEITPHAKHHHHRFAVVDGTQQPA